MGFFRQIFLVEKWTWQTGVFLLIHSLWRIAFPAAVLTPLFPFGQAVAAFFISFGFVVQAVKDPDSVQLSVATEDGQGKADQSYRPQFARAERQGM